MTYKKRFKITDYLEVVLTEDDSTEILINGEHFMQCSHVLTTIHTDEIENVLLLKSVDEIKKAPKIIVIDPETRFFVHCSNLQAFVENNFDTRLLHSNLSFPLLNKLIRGDFVSSIILKEEITKRIGTLSSYLYPLLIQLVEDGFVNRIILKEEIAIWINNLMTDFHKGICD